MCDYGSALYWDGKYLLSPPKSAVKHYCDYDDLEPILADNYNFTVINKEETTYDEDDGGNYDDNKGGDGGR